MADEELQDQDVQPKKGGKLKWIIIAVLLVVLAGGGYFAYTKFFAAPAEDAQAEKTDQSQDQQMMEEAEGTLVPLPLFLVNLADPLGRRYLKLGVEVEVRDEKVTESLNKNEAKIKDTMLLLLSSKTFDDLSTLKSKVELKQEIVRRLNQILGNGSILRVYITEMVIQ
ncbi:flagellar basal body-associated FliL family protein [Salidesulfovibrio onnuriiensis]|uniref:flagellar basal body-associated FliL family protein n=1 Tax=Salidesulfovibrio onnuriiensis TaxID=2583823 RepID=UPI0011CB15D6|nr:flagellar basal body-associated FliL family protein [Salidesulfovibrio onnuriiensis]